MSWHRVTIRGAIFGQTINNVLHFLNPDGAQTLTQIADIVDTHWVTNVLPCSSASLNYTNIEVRTVAIATPPSPFNKSINRVGAVTQTAPDTPLLSMLIRLQTAIAGRHGRGRVYLAGAPGGAMTAGNWSATTITARNINLAAILAALGSGGTQPIILHVCPRGDESAGVAVTALTLRTSVSVQRRRNYGVGI